jgi:hypothetical protein
LGAQAQPENGRLQHNQSSFNGRSAWSNL